MRKRLAFFFLTSSFVLILGHSILPHNHAGVGHRCKISDVKEPSLAEIIRLTLSHDLGTNHLEEYDNCNSTTISFSDIQEVLPIIRPIEFSFVTISSTGEIFKVICPEPDSQYFCSGSGLRAPPIRS